MSVSWTTGKRLLLTAAAAVVATGGTVGGVAAASASRRPSAAKTFTTDHQLCYTVARHRRWFRAARNHHAEEPVQHQGIQAHDLHDADPPLQPGREDPAVRKDHSPSPTRRSPAVLRHRRPHDAAHPRVSVTNQFGTADLQPAQPNRLCLPSWKSLTAPPDKTQTTRPV